MSDEPHSAPTDETAENAALYCLGHLSPEDRRIYAEHLRSCAICRSQVELYATVVADLAVLGAGDPPSGTRASFLTRVHREKGMRERWAKIGSVLITPQLPARPTRKKTPERLSAALDELATRLSGTEQELLAALVRAACELCDAGTAGFSVLYEDEKVFRWDAVAGALAAAKGGTTPSAWSPCGTTLALGTSQLFSRPSRCFEYFSSSPHPIVEGLVVPVYVGDKPLGTLWVASHDEREFDKDDLQVLERLASLCGSAIGRMREGQSRPDPETA